MAINPSSSRSTGIPYTTKHATSCLLVEVYLPKHVRNQGALIDLLLDVIELDKARSELQRRARDGLILHLPVERVLPVRILADDPPPAGQSNEIVELINKISEGLIGYSVYEVDGAFRPDNADQVAGAEAGGPAADDGATRAHATAKCDSSRRVPVRRSKPFRIPKKWIRAFASSPVGKERDLLVERLRTSPPLCEDAPQPERGPAFEVELSNCLYLVELIPDAEPPKVVATKCLRLYEERTLVVRFLIDLKSIENQAITARNGSSETTVTRIIEALLLIGEYLVRELGETVTTEDQIWIYYDVGHLWKWHRGKPQNVGSPLVGDN